MKRENGKRNTKVNCYQLYMIFKGNIKELHVRMFFQWLIYRLLSDPQITKYSLELPASDTTKPGSVSESKFQMAFFERSNGY